MSIFPCEPISKKDWFLSYSSTETELSSIYYKTLKSIPNSSFPIGRCPNYQKKLQSDCDSVKTIIRSLHAIFQQSTLTKGLTLASTETQIISGRFSALVDALDLPRCSLAQKSTDLICDEIDYELFYTPKTFLELKYLSLKTAAVALNFYDSMGFIEAPIESLCQFLDHFGIGASLKTAKLPRKTKVFIKEKTTQKEQICSRRKIGEGTYGKVYFLEYNQRPYVLKRMKSIKGGTPVEIRSLFLHEIAIHQMMHSFEHIVKIEACYETGIFLEYAPCGILFDFIDKKLSTPQKLKSFFSCIAKGLKAIHDRGFNFKDLKSNNVLIFSDHLAKICDLGFAAPSFYDIDDNVSQDYAAPEIFYVDGDNPISQKADIWSFGVVLFEALSCGRLPLFPDIRGDKNYLYFVGKASRQLSPLDVETLKHAIEPQNMDFFNQLDPNLIFLKIVQKCLHFNTLKRPDADELIELLEAIELV
jgi:hypothetical protein